MPYRLRYSLTAPPKVFDCRDFNSLKSFLAFFIKFSTGCAVLSSSSDGVTTSSVVVVVS